MKAYVCKPPTMLGKKANQITNMIEIGKHDITNDEHFFQN